MRIAILSANPQITKALYYLPRNQAEDLVSFGRAVPEGNRAIRLLQKHALEPVPSIFGNYSGGIPGSWYVQSASIVEDGSTLLITTQQFEQ